MTDPINPIQPAMPPSATVTVLGLLRKFAVGVLCAASLGAAAADTTPPAKPALQKLTVQLSWSHQTQFAGFYMAQRAKYFEQEGLDLVVLPGNASINPVQVLGQGGADVAISTLSAAMALGQSGQQLTNIAQIHQSSPILLMCRPSLGVSTPKDIVGKKIGVSGGGDAQILDALVSAIAPDGAGVIKVPRDGTGRLLIEGEVACITGVNFNEQLRVEKAGIGAADLLLIRPENHGVFDFGDGLYVRTERLQSPEFRAQLVGLLRALSKGWRDARKNPSLAVAQTLERNPALDRQFQHEALEEVLELIPTEDFGLLQLPQLQRFAQQGTPSKPQPALPAELWTHRIWNDWQRSDGAAKAMTPATRHALNGVAQFPLFITLVTVGTLLFSLSGALLAIERGYNIWGRLLVATMPAIGGGAVRDLMIGGPRLPFYFIADPTLPLAILAIVLASSLLIAVFPAWVKSRAFTVVMLVASIIGSAVIATNGAMVALKADVPWVWVPVFAAISCAGGGLLLDVVTNHHPRAFRGRLFQDEERGVLSGVTLLAFLWLANQFEDPGYLVYVGAAAAVLLNIAVLLKRDALVSYYPKWLTAGKDNTSPSA